MDTAAMMRFPSVPLVGLSASDCLLDETWTLDSAGAKAVGKTGPSALEPGKACSGHSPRSCLDAAAFSSRMPATSAAPSVGSVDAGADWTAGDSCEDSEDEDDLGGGKYARGGSSEAEDRTRLRRSGRNHPTDAKREGGEGGQKRKVGRPIIYVGDPDAPDLTPAERRRIRRRIANRESARRVRARRQDLLEEMAIKAREMEEHNLKLMQRAQSVETKHQAMLTEVAAMNEDLRSKCAENEALQAELLALRASLSQKAGSMEGAPSLDIAPRQMAADMGLPGLPGGGQPAGNVVSSGFSGSTPFSVMSGFAPLQDLSAAARCGTVVPAVTTGQQGDLLLPAVPAAAQAAQPHLAGLRAPSIEPAALAFSLDRSLSEFLNQVVCC